MPQPKGRVVHNENEKQFELKVPGGLAVLVYTQTPDGMDLLHTMVPPEDEGVGHGSTLVRAALDHARKSNERVIPTCPFVKAYLMKHPEDASLARDP